MTPSSPAPLAPLGRRLAARVVDAVLLGWCTAFVVVEIGARLLGGDPLARRAVEVDPGAVGTVLLVVACVALVEVLPVAVAGRTLGKAITGLELEDVDGGRPGWLAAVVRALVLYGGVVALPVVALPVVLVLLVSIVLSVERRGLHDRLAGTRVVLRPVGP